MIKLYGKPDCTFCIKAEEWLKRNNFQFEKIDVTEDAEALAFIKGRGHKKVPQIYYNSRILVEGGYDGLSSLRPEDLTHRIQQYDNNQFI